MSVPAAYLAVIAIWSTTPLAIKWSSEGPGYVAGVTGRMLIGTVICLLIVKLFRVVMPWHRRAVEAYVAGSLAVFGGMMSVYWGAQYIDSGMVALLFGLTPLATTLIAVVSGTESRPGIIKVFAIFIALVGLTMILLPTSPNTGIENTDSLYGMAAVFAGMLMHSVSTVWAKKAAQGLPAMAMTTGSLLMSLPLYLLSWYVIDGTIPASIDTRAATSIVYLGVFGSVFGYVLYFYALRHVTASKMALLTLVTPVTALLLGQALNNEQVTATVWTGTALILMGLVMHQWGHRLRLKPA